MATCSRRMVRRDFSRSPVSSAEALEFPRGRAVRHVHARQVLPGSHASQAANQDPNAPQTDTHLPDPRDRHVRTPLHAGWRMSALPAAPDHTMRSALELADVADLRSVIAAALAAK